MCTLNKPISTCAHFVGKVICLCSFYKQLFIIWMFLNNQCKTTFNNGSLGSRIDEERSEMRYVMWIAEFSESSNLWTHIAPSGIPEGMPVWVSLISQHWQGSSLFWCLDVEGLLAILLMSAPFKCISRNQCKAGFSLITHLSKGCRW